jgi:hypothetical protein
VQALPCPRASRRWAAGTLTALATLLAATAALVATVDPFQCYRRAAFYTPLIDEAAQAYYNIGLARNYPYDTLMLGSSMAQNARPSDVEAVFGGQAINIPFSGGSLRADALMLQAAFATRPLARVLLCLDDFAMAAPADTVPGEFPVYLYDQSLLNDAPYLLNTAVLERIWRLYLTYARGEAPAWLDLDDLYAWDTRARYGRDRVMTSIAIPRTQAPQGPAQADAANLRANLDENLLPYITAHPETRFLFYFPPYSQLLWYVYRMNGSLERLLFNRAAFAQALLTYDNVQVFDFQINEEWVCNPDLYKDYQHHNGDINAQMIADMATGRFEVTSPIRLSAHNDRLRALAAAFTPPTEEELQQMRRRVAQE